MMFSLKVPQLPFVRLCSWRSFSYFSGVHLDTKNEKEDQKNSVIFVTKRLHTCQQPMKTKFAADELSVYCSPQIGTMPHATADPWHLGFKENGASLTVSGQFLPFAVENLKLLKEEPSLNPYDQRLRKRKKYSDFRKDPANSLPQKMPTVFRVTKWESGPYRYNKQHSNNVDKTLHMDYHLKRVQPAPPYHFGNISNIHAEFEKSSMILADRYENSEVKKIPNPKITNVCQKEGIQPYADFGPDKPKPAKDKEREKEEDRRYKLMKLEDRLLDQLPQFLDKDLDYSIYHNYIVLEDYMNGKKKPKTVKGLGKYKRYMNSRRRLCKFMLRRVKFNILDSSIEAAESCVEIRWQITGNTLNGRAKYIDGVSRYYMRQDGRVDKHTIDRRQRNSVGVKNPTPLERLRLIFLRRIPVATYSFPQAQAKSCRESE